MSPLTIFINVDLPHPLEPRKSVAFTRVEYGINVFEEYLTGKAHGDF